MKRYITDMPYIVGQYNLLLVSKIMEPTWYKIKRPCHSPNTWFADILPNSCFVKFVLRFYFQQEYYLQSFMRRGGGDFTNHFARRVYFCN